MSDARDATAAEDEVADQAAPEADHGAPIGLFVLTAMEISHIVSFLTA